MTDMRTQAIMGMIPPDVGEAVIASRWPSVAAYGAIARRGSDIQARAHDLVLWTIKLPLPLAILLTVPATAVAFLIALVAWLMLAPFYFVKIIPGLATRYTLTNKAILVERDLFFGKTNDVNPMLAVPLASVVLGLWLLLLPLFLGRVFAALFLIHVLKRPADRFQTWFQIPTFWKRLQVHQSMSLTELQEVKVVPGTEQPFYLAADLELISTGGQKLVLKGVPEFSTFQRNIEDTWLAWGRKDPPKTQPYPGMPEKK